MRRGARGSPAFLLIVVVFIALKGLYGLALDYTLEETNARLSARRYS